MNENINQKSFNKTLLTIAGILLIAAVALASLYMYKEGRKDSDQTKEQAFSVSKTELIDTQIPSGFPEGLPVEEDAEVLQNYEAITTDGRTQSTRVMVTEEDPADAIKIYTDFFSKLGWVTVSGGSTTGSTTLMIKDSDSLLIAVNEAAAGSRSISLTLTDAQ